MRYLQKQIQLDLAKKMVFLGGPRQVGKTTVGLQLLHKTRGSELPGREHAAYLNWDVPASRDQILRGEFPGDQKLIVLDEIHKFSRWRNLLKGFFDQYQGKKSFLVSGSARLDYYNRGGDSLQGRYHYLRLHPLSLRELSGQGVPSSGVVKDLLEFGGFPEPFFGKDKVEWRRWQRERADRVVQEDLRDLERVQDVALIRLLVDALPERVGSPLSVNKLALALEVSHPTLKRYLEILENLYVAYRISPFGGPKIRAVKKEQKLYLWDWSTVEDEGARFENLMASQLLKYCHFREDTEGYRMELRYLRDTDGREVDFVVLQDRKPVFAVECKAGDRQLSSHIRYFRERTRIPRFYQVHLGQKDYGDPETGGRVLPFERFCEELELP
ncbi:MAG: ATP-binding protein [Oligoflexia bacterium]|nr:ATP-binding protein [Oligoflexia bacterium]